MHGSPRFPGALTLFAAVVAGLGAAGCAGKRGPEENQAAAHLRKIALAYDEVIYLKRRPPRGPEDLRPVLQEICKPDDPDVLLRSPNDGEPYEIVWGINLGRQTDGSVLLAYEKKGADGRRYAINVARVVTHLTDAEIGKASPPKGKGPGGG